ncbi:MAG: hypothetical protein CMP98_14240 [Gammaproteobacteria bacterium]|nr:hypothetical protein [Gammaproteobacteria bacterium]OUU06635.1 MAG: hypothetical protein CBB94_15030 [Gammaproteobacteria bacterium TMED34]
MTQVLAGVLGLKDHVVLKVRNHADVNVFDVSKLEGHMPETVYDFIFGASRFIQRAVSYKNNICNRTLVLQDDELTGVCRGMILRSQG